MLDARGQNGWAECLSLVAATQEEASVLGLLCWPGPGAFIHFIYYHVAINVVSLLSLFYEHGCLFTFMHQLGLQPGSSNSQESPGPRYG